MKFTQFLVLSALGAFCLSAQSEPAGGEVSMMKVPEEGVIVPQAKIAQSNGDPCEKRRCEQSKPKCDRPKLPPCEKPKPKCERPKPPCETPEPKCERPKPPKCEEKCVKKPKCPAPSRCDKCLENPGSCKSAARKVVEGS